MDTILRMDMTMLALCCRPVWAVSRWTGLDNFQLARIMVIASPVLLTLFWMARYGFIDVFGQFGVAIWSFVCFTKLSDFRREERLLRRDWANGGINLMISAASVRVTLLLLFASMDLARLALDFTLVIGNARIALMLAANFYTTLYALALYVHLIPPAPPRRKKRDWLAWLRRAPLPVPT